MRRKKWSAIFQSFTVTFHYTESMLKLHLNHIQFVKIFWMHSPVTPTGEGYNPTPSRPHNPYFWIRPCFFRKGCSPPHQIRGLGSAVSSHNGVRGKALATLQFKTFYRLTQPLLLSHGIGDYDCLICIIKAELCNGSSSDRIALSYLSLFMRHARQL